MEASFDQLCITVKSAERLFASAGFID